MTPEAAIVALKTMGDGQKAREMARYHKAPRIYLGLANPAIDALCKSWRADLTLSERLDLCHGLWVSNIHEGRVAAAKLLTQARIRPDDTGAWELIASWVPDFDGWAIADHVSIAGQRRLMADPTRLDEVERWTISDHMWTRRAALVTTLPWTKIKNPKPEDLERRERILTWAATYVTDHDWFIQKSVGWWLRDLSKHDPERVRSFLAEHGAQLKPFAHKEASRKLPDEAPSG